MDQFNQSTLTTATETGLGGRPETVNRIRVAFELVAFWVLYDFFLYLTGDFGIHNIFYALLILFFYFAHPQLRVLWILAIPFVVQQIVYDALRYIPFQWLAPIHISQPYILEKILFGINLAGKTVLPNEWLLQFSHPVFDIVSGIIYPSMVPVAVALLFGLRWFHSNDLAQRYAAAFFVISFLGLTTNIFYPAAAPWYVAKYGFLQPSGFIPGDPAGLIKFDQLLGIHFTANMFHLSPMVFGALPSLHGGITFLGFLYARRMGKFWAGLTSTYFLTMCFVVIYSQHHYIIDLLLGVIYALLAYTIVEKFALRSVRSMYQIFFDHFVTSGPPTLLK